ncbi:MAG TPA: aminopeptidase P N-terminal domain-containing protein [Verrucomicrobiae bacterium]|nr:aminopeptidase P N-terminal domain-containing protein [Verrucomicrobiae bacterium]
MRFFLLFAVASLVPAQPVFTDVFPPEEFAARRAKVFDKISDGVAVVLGTTEPPGEMPLRQNNQFHYLCGVVEPRAILVLDGKTRKTTLFLNPRNQQQENSMYGPGLYPGEEAAKRTGIDFVLPRVPTLGRGRGAAAETAVAPQPSEFQAAMEVFAKDGRTFYTPFRPEVLGSISSGGPDQMWAANKNDPWDGRTSREEAFRMHLKLVAPRSEIKDLDPILNELRGIKSPREIAVIRAATRIAGLGIMEAMRDTKPGLYEYELQADSEFVFKKYGAFGASYFALIGTGPNTYYTHYHRDTAKLQDGELVQYDYAPDYKNYQSDVTRVWPANGKFTPWQKEYYNIYLKLYQAVMTSIKVHVTAGEVLKDAVAKMDGIMASYPFTDDKIRGAAAKFVENYRRQAASGRGGLGHTVGMEVHDVRMPTATLEPGEIFTIEPEMRIEELHLGLRLEDMLLITETGYENLSRFVPIEVADIEKLMADNKHSLSAAHATLQVVGVHN